MKHPTKEPDSFLDRYFQLSLRSTTIGREIRGGLVTFIAMSYILVVNASVLGVAAPDNISPASIAAGTALIGGVMTIIMGVVANFPMALASGMGLNAIVAFTLANKDLLGLTFQEAMGLIFWEGVAITILVITGFREAVFKAVPSQLKIAISVGIGLFIAFIGLINAGVVRPGGTPVQLGINGSFDGWPMVVFLFGLVVIIVLHVRKIQGALLIGIASSTVLAMIVQSVAKIPAMHDKGEVVNPTGWSLNVPALEGAPIALPDFSTLGAIDFFGAFSKLGPVAVLLLIFSLMLADFFDTMGTMVAVGAGANLLDKESNPPKAKEILLVDSLAAVAGGLGGVSSNTSYVESTAGVGEGARTGLASVVTGVLMLLAMFFAPIVDLVPAEAASTALVFVGFLMMLSVSDIDWHDTEIALPAFFTIAMMPFTYSITTGIGLGFIAYVVVKLARGKIASIHPLMWIISILFMIYFALTPIQTLLG
ncbi:MAG: NCS2 family permease [Actinomycetaceae bacterium]|nr:NCS2 family permease [Actinomycetaceae bacterium]MDO5746995.1 NCS2 family permease [Actinomycetaceae bacterium]